jgi:hypothetical protein
MESRYHCTDHRESNVPDIIGGDVLQEDPMVHRRYPVNEHGKILLWVPGGKILDLAKIDPFWRGKNKISQMGIRMITVQAYMTIPVHDVCEIWLRDKAGLFTLQRSAETIAVR